METAIKWIRLDNFEGTRTLKQHAYIPASYYDPILQEAKVGNIQLCDQKDFASHDGERPSDWNGLEPETKNTDHICLKCLSVIESGKTKFIQL